MSSNLNPTTGAYGVLNIHSSYQVTKNVQVFALLENALNPAMRRLAHSPLSDPIRR